MQCAKQPVENGLKAAAHPVGRRCLLTHRLPRRRVTDGGLAQRHATEGTLPDQYGLQVGLIRLAACCQVDCFQAAVHAPVPDAEV